MADPCSVLPYHDPYDLGQYNEIMNLLYDDSDPILENVPPPLEGLSSPNHDYHPIHHQIEALDGGDHHHPMPLFDGVQDFDHLLSDPNPTMGDLGNLSIDNNVGGSDSQAGPSQIFGELSNFDPPRGDEFDRNPRFADVRPLTVWPEPPVPFNCSCCQVLREIIHFNSNDIMKLEIHGRLGMICHAILEIRRNIFNVNSSDDNQYQMFDFCKKSIEEVKQFLMQYCLERKLEGYSMQQDPLAIFYEALCVGMDWDDILNTDDFIPASSPNPGAEGEMEQPANPPEAAENEIERTRRFSLAEQRERTANMTLDDLREYFHLTIEEAAKRLLVCPTVVKRICRKYGLSRWPSRKIKSIERQKTNLRPSLCSNDAEIRARAQAEIQRLETEVASLVP